MPGVLDGSPDTIYREDHYQAHDRNSAAKNKFHGILNQRLG